MSKIESNVSYEIDDDGQFIAENVAVHRETGDSEFDYVLVGSNADRGSEMVAFGFHEQELPIPINGLEDDQ